MTDTAGSGTTIAAGSNDVYGEACDRRSAHRLTFALGGSDSRISSSKMFDDRQLPEELLTYRPRLTTPCARGDQGTAYEESPMHSQM